MNNILINLWCIIIYIVKYNNIKSLSSNSYFSLHLKLRESYFKLFAVFKKISYCINHWVCRGDLCCHEKLFSTWIEILFILSEIDINHFIVQIKFYISKSIYVGKLWIWLRVFKWAIKHFIVRIRFHISKNVYVGKWRIWLVVFKWAVKNRPTSTICLSAWVTSEFCNTMRNN